jgi:hypothetical protein
MAQTKRKRPSKHRGNAAGMIEARGRTGRKPTAEEKRPAGAAAGPKGKGGKAPTVTVDKYATPPTWKGAINRAVLASVFVLGLAILVLHYSVGQMAAVLPAVLLIYVPLGYYTDLFIYNRRQRQKAAK